MKKLNNVLLLYILIISFGCGNNPPFINSLTPESETVAMGQDVSIICDAYDDEDETLVYSWDCTSGTIVGEENSAIWTAPNQTGVFSISCQVMDSNHGNAIETIDITVL